MVAKAAVMMAELKDCVNRILCEADHHSKTRETNGVNEWTCSKAH